MLKVPSKNPQLAEYIGQLSDPSRCSHSVILPHSRFFRQTTDSSVPSPPPDASPRRERPKPESLCRRSRRSLVAGAAQPHPQSQSSNPAAAAAAVGSRASLRLSRR